MPAPSIQDIATLGSLFGNGNVTATISSGSNRLMVVLIAVGSGGSPPDVSAVTWDGSGTPVSLTQLNYSAIFITATEVEIWYLIAPAVHTNGTVAVTANTGGNQMWVQVLGLINVDQTTGLDNYTDTNNGTLAVTSSSISVPSAVGNLVIDVLCLNQANGTNDLAVTGAGQSSIYIQNSSIGSGGSQNAGASSVTMSWSWGTSARAIQAGCNVLAVSTTTVIGPFPVSRKDLR